MDSKKINSILFFAICAVLAVIIIVSLSFFGVKEKQKQKIINQIQHKEQVVPSEKTAYFKEFGRIRTFTKDSSKIPIILTPVIAYEKNNTPLYEELCQKKLKIQSIITEFFTDKTKKQINQIGDETIKAQLIRQIDEVLTMGQIDDLYFSEFMFLD